MIVYRCPECSNLTNVIVAVDMPNRALCRLARSEIYSDEEVDIRVVRERVESGRHRGIQNETKHNELIQKAAAPESTADPMAAEGQARECGPPRLFIVYFGYRYDFPDLCTFVFMFQEEEIYELLHEFSCWGAGLGEEPCPQKC